MKRKLIKRNKNKLCDLRQTARQQDHPVNLYLSSRVTLLRQLYSIIKSIRAMPEGRLEHQSISFDKTFSYQDILAAIYQDLQSWSSDIPDSTALKVVVRQGEIMRRLFPNECKKTQLENVNLEWLIMEMIGFETGDYSLKRTHESEYQRQSKNEESDNINAQTVGTATLPKQFRELFEQIGISD